MLHAPDHLALDSERADETIEVGDDDHAGFACLQHRDCTAHARTAIEWRTAGDVRLLQRVDELEPVALAGGPDTLSLLGRRDQALAITVTDAADADDPNGSTYGGALAD